MKTLHEYLQAHCERGACQCGKCFDAPENPAEKQPEGHTADLAFFKVRAVGNPVAEELTDAIKAHSGEWGEVDLFDGKEHNYMEIGGWIGDQGAAMMLMGLGSILGLWRLMTPRSMLGADLPDDLVMQMAGMGMVAIQALPRPEGLPNVKVHTPLPASASYETGVKP